MTSGNAGGNKQGVSVFTAPRTVIVDQIKEDGVRKELYENERKAQANWAAKWGFLENPKNLRKEEAEKAGLLLSNDIFDQKPGSKSQKSLPKTKKSEVVLRPSPAFPKLSSGMIGWRSSSKENNLNLVAGPLYSNRKQTMNPPLDPAGPDLNYQRIIFLG